MVKIALSYGHGANTFEDKHSKGVIVGGKAYEEHTFNSTVGEKVRKILEAHGVDVIVVQPPMGKDVPLQVRTDKANAAKVDLYWSIHANAASPTAKGLCAFYWKGSTKGHILAQRYADLCKEAGFPLYSDGTYPSERDTWSDFHELRETNMIAILTENGFMTNKEDFKKIFQNEDHFYDKLALIHAKTILYFFGITYKAPKAAATKKRFDFHTGWFNEGSPTMAAFEKYMKDKGINYKKEEVK